MMEFVGLSAAAHEIGITPGALKWHLNYGRVADVKLRGPTGCRLFTPEDIRRLQTLLRPARKNPKHGLKPTSDTQ